MDVLLVCFLRGCGVRGAALIFCVTKKACWALVEVDASMGIYKGPTYAVQKRRGLSCNL